MLKRLVHPASFWRAATRLANLPRHWRCLNSQPRLNVVCIAPMRNEAERRRFFAQPEHRLQHASGAAMRLGPLQAQVRGFNITVAELATRAGRKLGRELVIECAQWAQAQGARVVLLAEGARRLFGADGAELKARFPQLLFTTGDNAAALLLVQDLERTLALAFPARLAEPAPQPRILVLGAQTSLGRAVLEQLQMQGRSVLGADAAEGSWVNLGPVDAVVVCSADPAARLNLERVQQLRRRHRRLLVIDGVEPPSMDAATLAACGDWVLHQSRSLLRVPALRWGLGAGVLGLQTHGARRLCARTVEALALYQAVFQGQSALTLSRDWFEGSAFNRFLLAQALSELDVQLDAPRSGGTRIHSFELTRRDAIRTLALPESLETLPMPLRA